MKKIISLLALMVSAVFCYAQGTVNMNNRVTASGIDAPVFDVDGATKLSGTGFFIQLYAGISSNDLYPVGAAINFRAAGAQAGYMLGGDTIRTIQGIPPGGAVYVQLRAWDAAFATYEEAGNAQAKAGTSLVLFLPATGDPTTPTPGTPVNLVGLQSFSVWGLGFDYTYIQFSNRVASIGLDAPISGPNGRLAGDAYKAQLYVFLNHKFCPVGDPQNFMTGTNAGYIDYVAEWSGDIGVGVPIVGGDPIVLVAAWRAADGATYDEAATNGLVGVSSPLRLEHWVTTGFLRAAWTLRTLQPFTLGETVIAPDEAVLIPQPMLVNGRTALIWGNTGSVQWEVQYKNTLSETSWTTLGTAQVTNHLAGVYIDTTATNATRIYRLKQTATNP